MRYPERVNEVLFNLLASHDTARVLTQLGGDKRKLKLAVAFQLTFTGTPCVYYGDEIGLEGEGDPDCRKSMIWDVDQQDLELRQSYRQLIRLRKEHSTLYTGHFNFLKADTQERSLIYERYDGEGHFTIWMNPAEEPVTLSYALAGHWQDAFTGEAVSSADDGQVKILLKPYGYKILKFINLINN
ncbi:Neopullulanase [compost metagenome]